LRTSRSRILAFSIGAIAILMAPYASAAPAALAAIAFDRLDANGDGSLDTTELTAIGERRMSRLDANGDGWLTNEEFTRGRRQAADQLAGGASPIPAIDFDSFDMNGDGMLGKDELIVAESTRVITLADDDSNGVVSRDEFMALANGLAIAR
jgi:hypothetical protein